MTSAFLVLAEGDSMFPWYNWVLIAVVIAIIVGYKMYQKKMMS